MEVANEIAFGKTGSRGKAIGIRHWHKPESRRWQHGDCRTASLWQDPLDGTGDDVGNALMLESPNV
jgi:hypothetical protein